MRHERMSQKGTAKSTLPEAQTGVGPLMRPSCLIALTAMAASLQSAFSNIALHSAKKGPMKTVNAVLSHIFFCTA